MMASGTKEKDMASDLVATGADEPEDRKPQGPGPSQREERTSFFHIYKPGQGYWTRMGTAFAAGLLAALTANFLYHQLPVWLGSFGMKPEVAKQTSLYIIGGFVALFALLVFWLMNKPNNADF